MTFRLSTTFKLIASTRVAMVIDYFQFSATMKLQQPQLSPAITTCCKLSKLSDLNTFFNETSHKVLRPVKQAACPYTYWLTKDYKAVCSSSPAAGWGRA
tara:strand:+ start:571 stop:867 length:297 start_codon:yes stop_codon:yes gene_type:complete